MLDFFDFDALSKDPPVTFSIILPMRHFQFLNSISTSICHHDACGSDKER